MGRKRKGEEKGGPRGVEKIKEIKKRRGMREK